jgi:hypothetical protein
VVTARGRRLAALAVAAAALATGGAACSSGSSSSSTPPQGTSTGTGGTSAAGQRAASSAPLLVQCALDQHDSSLAASAAKYSGLLPAGQRWLRGGKIALTKNNAGQFTGWFEGHVAGVSVHGKRFDDWSVAAAQSGKLPAAVCGAGASARQLYAQVFAQFPSMSKTDPWQD